MKTIILAMCLGLSSAVCAAQDKTEESKNEELFACVKSGDADCVKRALNSGAEANAADEGGARVLSMAAEGQSVAVVRLLISAGADVNEAGEGAGTPLCRAALFGRKEIAETLLNHGAKASLACGEEHDDSPLMEAVLAAGLHSMPPEVTEEFIETEGKEDDKSGEGDAAQDESDDAKTWREVYKVSPADFIAVARLLIARGADVNAVAKCDVGETALMYAAMGANVEMVKELLEHGADVNRGGSVLELLREFDDEYVKTRGLALPALSKEQSAMLAWNEKTKAAREEIRQLLRAAGAKEGEKDEGEDTRSAEEALVEAADEAFTSTVKKSDLEDLERLIKAYAGHPLGARAMSEGLRTAVVYNRRECFRLLLANGADPNGSRFKPLMDAVNNDDVELVRLLLEAGAEVNATDDDGRTALDLAEAHESSNEEHRTMIDLLKSHGARSESQP